MIICVNTIIKNNNKLKHKIHKIILLMKKNLMNVLNVLKNNKIHKIILLMKKNLMNVLNVLKNNTMNNVIK